MYLPNLVVFTTLFETFMSISEQFNITIIDVIVFLYILKLLDFNIFQICFHFSEV